MATSPYGATVRANVIRAMESAGVSQAGLCEATAIPRTTFLRRLAGTSPFTVDELALIAGSLNIDVAALTEPSAA